MASTGTRKESSLSPLRGGGDRDRLETNYESINKQKSDMTLLEWVYEMFQTRYGFEQIADKKFKRMIYACIVYKQKYPRIRLFGRFLGVYKERNLPKKSSLKSYLECVDAMFKMVLNFQIQEAEENPIVPLPKAIDYFK